MRRFVLFLICVIILLISANFGKSIDIFDNIKLRGVGYYSYSDYLGTSCGNLHIITDKANYMLAFGEYAYIDDDYFDIAQFIQTYDINIIAVDDVQDVTLYVLYCNRLPKYRIINGQKYNLQIALTNSCVKIGYPAIFDSF